MHAFFISCYHVLARLDGFGLLLLGVLDSSFVFMPFGNDLLLVAMTAQHKSRWLFFVAMAATGSVLGCLITDAISRKGGEAGLEKKLSRKRLEFVKAKITKNAGWAIGFAALMPPPFPFTPFVAAAAVLQYPRKKLLATVAIGRMARFGVEGILAVLLGRRILQWADSPILHYTVLGVLVLSALGTGVSIYSWLHKSKRIEPGR